MCVPIRNVSVSIDDLLRASHVLRVLIVRRTDNDNRALVETNRFQRRELTRYGISYREQVEPPNLKGE